MESRERKTSTNKIERVRQLNDEFRRTGQNGQIFLTQGIYQLPVTHKIMLLDMIQHYDDFSPNNDPYGEHDFGSISLCGEQIFWKIDYYDLDFVGGSSEPADPEVTLRVMTIMLASEY